MEVALMTSRSVKWLEWKWAYTLTIHKKKRIYTKIWFTLRRSKYCHHCIRKFCERGGKGFKSCLRKLQVAWSEIKGSHSVCPTILSLWFRDFLYPTPWYPGAQTFKQIHWIWTLLLENMVMMSWFHLSHRVLWEDGCSLDLIVQY